MNAVLEWIDVLNEQASWKGTEDFLRWVKKAFGRQIVCSDLAIEAFQEGLSFIRQQLYAIHFARPVDFESINKRLMTVLIQLKPPGTGLSGDKSLPLMHSQPRGTSDDTFLSCVLETLLLQFCFFLDQHYGPENMQVARCEGLYREYGSHSISPVESVAIEDELSWRKEIPALVDAGLEDSVDILRCADFFISRPKGRFCSDECRFRTFQINKQLSQPEYLADKQRRYRQRKDS